MRRVALCLLGCMAENLGLHPEKLAGSFTEGPQSIRMNYYPPYRHHADRVLGLSPHSDRARVADPEARQVACR
ncbi:hypothetical protein Taro_030040 [Colocasia esculenta]|uniref:Uncharacterized protein n=1 Tax=Colocasia esculenta TaxID=4460 RepID=A0A843VFB6_COLES|nr:hypothetical protein [Colocasia esculenta]